MEKQKLNRFSLLLGLGSLVFLAAGGAPRIELYRDGKILASFSRFQLAGRTVFLPLHESARALGFESSANPRTRLCFFRTPSGIVLIDSNRRTIQAGGVVKPLDFAPLWTKDEVFIPDEVYTKTLASLLHAEIEVKIVLPEQENPLLKKNGDSGKPLSPGIRNPVDVIVIDPGHGGRDTGAIGPGGIREKDVTLDLARKLARRLNREPGVTAVLTREGDTYLSLGERPRKARESGGDLFVSIHANAYERVSAKGFETFFASLSASDQAAMELARWENQVEEEPSPEAAGIPDDIQMILGDMAQTESLAESQELAALVQENLARVMNTENRGVKQAPFKVLMEAAMPAILVEVGFITNPSEVWLITDPEMQDKIVEAIAEAILRYRDMANAKMGLAPGQP